MLESLLVEWIIEFFVVELTSIMTLLTLPVIRHNEKGNGFVYSCELIQPNLEQMLKRASD